MGGNLNAIATGNVQANPAGKAAWIVLVIAWICFLVPIPGLGLFLGWPLNLVAFILAIVAIAKGGAMKGVFQLICSLVVSPIVYFVGFVLFAGAVGAAGQAADARQKAAASTSGTSPVSESSSAEIKAGPIAITAGELYRAYSANEIAADAQFKGKALLISGKVESIQSDFSDSPVVQLAAGDFEWVQLHEISKEAAGALAKGQSVTVSCTGQGEVIGFPSAGDCTIQ